MSKKKLRIALLFIHNDIMSSSMEEIGISCIASLLRTNGYEVLLASYREDRMNYDRVQEFNPDIIGLSIYYLSKDSVFRVSRRLKKILPDTIICGGGIHATMKSKKILQENSVVDLVVRGEGEETFLEFVNRLNNGEDYRDIKGISYRSGNRIIENEDRPLIADLDGLPFAARDILTENKVKVAVLSTSRGCRASCSFCASQLFWNRWRGRSVNNIVDEIEYVINHCGVNVCNFVDGSFEDPDKNFERLSGIAEEIIRRSLKLSYFVDVRAEIQRTITPEIIELLKQSGLWSVCIGIESANREDLQLYKKIATVEDNHKAIELFRKNEININPGFIVFNPYSTKKSLKENLAFLSRCGFPTKFFSCLRVFEGTRIYSKLKSDNLLGPGADGNKILFKDREIGQFYDFLFKYIDFVETNHHIGFHHLDYYSTLFWHELTLYRKILMDHKDNSALHKMDNIIGEYKSLLQEFNHSVSRWFGSLLDILASGWDYPRLDSCTNRLMPISVFLKYHKAFGNIQKKIFLHLSRSGYSSVLINI